MRTSKYLRLFFALFVVCFCLKAYAEECGCGGSETDWKRLLQDNKEFIHNPKYAKERARLADGQNPAYAILSCSDSRVPPEIIFDQGLGDLFVARVAGNIADQVVVDSLEFAVTTWDVTTLIVMGHTSCGAVEGALARLRENNGRIDSVQGDHLYAVLVPIEIAIVKSGIDIWASNALELATRANVAYAVKQLIKRSSGIKHALKDGQIIIVGAEYHLRSGKVKELFMVNQCGYSYDSDWNLPK